MIGSKCAEDRDEYISEGVFWVPEHARWSYISDHSKQPEIGQIVDQALDSLKKKMTPYVGYS